MSIEDDIAFVLSTINITREKYEEHIVSCTNLVADKTVRATIPHLIHDSLRFVEGPGTRYVVFGADKCGVSNVRQFFKLLDIDYQDLVDATTKYPLGTDTPDFHFRGYMLCSRNKDLCVNVTSSSSKDGYFHYMNITAEETAGLNAFRVFQNLGSHSGQCWGGYW